MSRDQKTKRIAEQIGRDTSAGYTHLVAGATANHFAGLDAVGDLIDSGYSNASYIKGDGMAGRVLRQIQLIIENGTNAATLKCTTSSLWNGDAIGETNNIAKGATTGDFTLNAGGTQLDIESSGLTAGCVMAQGSIASNSTGTNIQANIYDNGANDIRLIVTNATTGGGLDITTLVDTGTLVLNILYMTSV